MADRFKAVRLEQVDGATRAELAELATADLPAGDYRLRLKVGDVSTREIATSECRIRVHGTPHR